MNDGTYISGDWKIIISPQSIDLMPKDGNLISVTYGDDGRWHGDSKITDETYFGLTKSIESLPSCIQFISAITGIDETVYYNNINSKPCDFLEEIVKDHYKKNESCGSN